MNNYDLTNALLIVAGLVCTVIVPVVFQTIWIAPLVFIGYFILFSVGVYLYNALLIHDRRWQ